MATRCYEEPSSVVCRYAQEHFLCPFRCSRAAAYPDRILPIFFYGKRQAASFSSLAPQSTSHQQTSHPFRPFRFLFSLLFAPSPAGRCKGKFHFSTFTAGNSERGSAHATSALIPQPSPPPPRPPPLFGLLVPPRRKLTIIL